MEQEGKMSNSTVQSAQTSQSVAGSEKPGEGNSQAQTGQTGQQSGQTYGTKPQGEGKCKPPEGDTAKDKLSQMDKDDQASEIQTKNDTKLAECLKAKNGALKKLYTEYTRGLDGYSEWYQNQKEQLHCLEESNKKRLNDNKDLNEKTQNNILCHIIGMVDANITDLSQCIDKLECVDEKDDGQCSDQAYTCSEKKPVLDLVCKKSNLNKLTSLKKANDEFERSERNHYLKEKVFNDLKEHKTLIENNIKTILDYQKKINDARDEDTPCKRYTYILMIKKILDDTTLKAPDAIKTELETAFEALRCAKIDMCHKEYQKNIVNDTLTALKRELSEAEKSRESDILERISRISS